ncbi:anti-sigma F factor antagonist [Mechercharimyces sp. CAU 1602]|nr:anti-sigma F factor antagonist [Mechercharimyces sp. CAU 1602]
MSLHVDVISYRNVLVVRLAGELDHHTAEEVRTRVEKELETGMYRNLILNLQRLTFMDSSGLGVVLGRYKTMAEKKGTMRLCSVQPSVSRLFQLSGIHKILTVYDTEESALTACGVAS